MVNGPRSQNGQAGYGDSVTFVIDPRQGISMWMFLLTSGRLSLRDICGHDCLFVRYFIKVILISSGDYGK